MHDFVSFNHRVLAFAKASISAVSAAALYAKGIFTTIAIYDRQPFLWEKHWRRLCGNASKLEIGISAEKSVKQHLAELIEANGVTNGRARITFFDDSPSAVWPFGTEPKTSLLIMTGDFRPVPDNFRVTISPYRLNSSSPLAGLKSCNYLDKVLALDETQQRGYHEAIQLNERGEIASACMANVFWLRNGQLFTPSLKTACLAGTTREFVLENCNCLEVEVGIGALKDTDSVFLTSAGIGVVQVTEFDGRKLKAKSHKILDLLPRVK